MPASLPLMERLAAHTIHKHHHRLEEHLELQSHNPHFRRALVRDALMTVPAGLDKSGGGTGRLNWKMLQVRS